MARLIEYHTNCPCGRDIHVTADSTRGNLTVETRAGNLGPVRQSAKLPTTRTAPKATTPDGEGA